MGSVTLGYHYPPLSQGQPVLLEHKRDWCPVPAHMWDDLRSSQKLGLRAGGWGSTGSDSTQRHGLVCPAQPSLPRGIARKRDILPLDVVFYFAVGLPSLFHGACCL